VRRSIARGRLTLISLGGLVACVVLGCLTVHIEQGSRSDASDAAADFEASVVDSSVDASDGSTLGPVGNDDVNLPPDGAARPACVVPVDAGLGPPISCSELPKTCGPTHDQDCCASTVVPGGSFNRLDKISMPATVSDFRMDTYEVTVGRFRRFVAAYSPKMIDAGAGANPCNPNDPGWTSDSSHWLPETTSDLLADLNCGPAATWTDSDAGAENRPINCVTWYEAEAFCIWDHGRLPTLAEWSYAAVGGSEQRAYPWGSAVPGADAALAVYNCYYPSGGVGGCDGATTISPDDIAPVGSLIAGAAKWGQLDMAGNVAEWVQDADPVGPRSCFDCAAFNTSPDRVFLGGSFISISVESNAPQIFVNSSWTAFDVAGIRCVRSP
jgi:formylglycine-generating enzyme required for sulfatase activity